MVFQISQFKSFLFEESCLFELQPEITMSSIFQTLFRELMDILCMILMVREEHTAWLKGT